MTNSKQAKPQQEQTTDDTPEQIQIRKEKREKLLQDGKEAYPVAVSRTHTLQEIRQKYPDLEAGDETGEEASVVGRVVFIRNTGKLCFASLQEGNGTRLQAMISFNGVGEEALAAWKTEVDLGDYVSVTGQIISSKRGELSIMASSWQMASKALRPLPTMHNELNEETRVRQRYVDLIVREDARKMVQIRSAVLRSLRKTLEDEGFLEVETPMLHPIHGGASATPFTTHINAYDSDLYLRIAPELYLKKAAVGGIEKVFEINRNFRNEGADSTHSPEFAAIEAYEAYGDYKSIAALTQKMVQNAAVDATGSTTVTLADGNEYDFGGQWPWLSIYDSLSEKLNVEITPDTSVAELEEHAQQNDVDLSGIFRSHGKLVEEIWEELIGNNLQEPTFVCDFPLETSPLTRQHRDNPAIVEKWDLYVRGFELGTGYSELVDPVIQRERFENQAKMAAQGDVEAMQLDEDFLTAMEHGMPPTGGMGMGIDRLLMALTGLGIRETILFPFVKPGA
ncbi:MAG: lysine--tRNA ligase [Micrococcaceae bacterium]